MSRNKKPTRRELELQRQKKQLQARLAEAEDTLRAIREGEVDAVVVSGTKGDEIFSLVSTDSIYRLIVDTMKEAAFTVTSDGKILFCNPRFGEFVNRPLDDVVGHSLREFVSKDDLTTASALLASPKELPVRRLVFRAADGTAIPAHISATMLNQPEGISVCVVASDLSELERSTDLIRHLRRQQDVLRASESRFRSLFENSLDAVFLTLADGQVLAANPAARAMFDMSNVELIRAGWQALVDPGDSSRFAAVLEEWRRTGRVVKRELTLVRRNGERFTAEVDSIAFPGAPGGHFVILRDITERKQAEQQLFDTSQRLQALMNALPVGVSFSNDATCRDITGNPAVLAQYDAGPDTNLSASATDERALGRQVRYFREGRQISDVELPLQRAVAENREIPPEELEVELPSGRRWRTETSGAPIRDRQGNVVGGVAVTVDVTARRRAEERIRQHGAIREAVNEVLGAALTCPTDQDLGVACLRVAERLTQSRFGFIAEIRNNGLEPLALSDPGWQGCAIDAEGGRRLAGTFKIHGIYGRVVSDARSVLANDPAHHPDRVGLPAGHPALESFLGVPLVREGRPIGMIAVGNRPGGYRTSDREALETLSPAVVQAFLHRRAEQALQESKDVLEHRVEERTAALAQRAMQLRALAGELTLSEQRERRRLAELLHDHLQQWLFAAKVQVARLGGRVDEPLKAVVTEVDQLLSASLNASRSLTAELSPPLLHEQGLVSGLQWLVRWMADTYHLTADLDLAEDIPALTEDVKVLLFESVRELLFNVVKHAGVDAASVQVRAANEHLRVVVSDKGSGFEPGQLPPPGTLGRGFGLFTIHERVGLIGGRMEIESAPGKASRITIEVPVAPSVPVPPPADGTPAAMASLGQFTLPATGQKIRVLLVDDHAVIRHGLERLINDEPDMQVVGQAADGRAAIALARILTPDVVLMDLSMPELGGIDATRVVTSELPRVRVIGLTIHEEAEMVQAMLTAGAAACLSKRESAEQILTAIRASRKR